MPCFYSTAIVVNMHLARDQCMFVYLFTVKESSRTRPSNIDTRAIWTSPTILALYMRHLFEVFFTWNTEFSTRKPSLSAAVLAVPFGPPCQWFGAPLGSFVMA